MTKTPMDAALMTCKLPTCKRCMVKAKTEIIGTEASSYTARICIVCPKCSKTSDWHEYDNYCHSIPMMWDVLRKAFVDFSEKG